MDHNLFKPKNIEDAKHSVVGDCNGIPMAERWEKETPVFAKAILSHAQSKPGFTILDYGCGCGRLSKEILKQDSKVTVIGLDASKDELRLAKEYVNDSRFIPVLPHELNQKVDLIYCVYCLQHVPAIEIREVLQRIHTFLKDDGIFVYCSSDYRMAIRFDGQGFFDDRFLGVNLREEIGRLFKETGSLFDMSDPALEPVVKKMVWGELPHPAKFFKKKAISGHLFNAEAWQEPRSSEVDHNVRESKTTKHLILRNRQSPGDILVMSTAIRALKAAYGDRFLIDVHTPCNEIFDNNPYLNRGAVVGVEDQVIDMHYPLISDHKARGFNLPGAGVSGRHFSDGHRKFLEEILEVEIPRAGLLPDIFLTQDERLWPSPLLSYFADTEKYWVLNAGSKSDYPLKQYHRWQEVVDIWNKLNPDIKIVQIGQTEHNHPALNGVLDMRGKTSIRQLFRLIHHSEGVLSCVSFPMHAAAALEKPCVVVAGGRESTRWELYPNQRFLYTNGALDCCLYDGCWKNKIDECKHPTNFSSEPGETGFKAPLCMEMIRPHDITRSMELYYMGGVLSKEVAHA